MSDYLTTKAIKTALRARYSGAEWALFFEVAQATGAMAGRSADAIAMNMYPSRGLRVHGVEVKASRGDWLRELKNPAKAEPIQRYCDHWWIAAAKDVVKPEELPPTWGLMELHGATLRQRVVAPKLEAEPMGRPFIASLLRNAAGAAARDLHEAVQKQTEDARAKMREDVERAVKDRTYAHNALKEKVVAFEAASGLDISRGWQGGKEMGAAVKLLMTLGITSAYGSIRNMATTARRFADDVDKHMVEMAVPDFSEVDEAAE